MSGDDPSIGNGAEVSSSQDAEVARILDEYLADLEAGRPADPDRLLAGHPAIASQLRDCLEVMHLAGRVADLRETVPDIERDRRIGPRLADYRIVRQIGRGGMGIVYEAEQQSLRRRVALKVLPLASAIDPRQLRRFHVEAQAAAQLHHTHIVPVHAVGCEGGVHYYAMQYIEGKSLAELIRELRQFEDAGGSVEVPTVVLGQDQSLAGMLASGRLAPEEGPGAVPTIPAAKPAATRLRSSTSARTSAYVRTVANLGIQAADALEHAHQEGIVHRDIKPANLMIDVKGHLWITDFGLARLQNDSSLTQSGDLVGTIRYMSPEQANGRNGLVDHRTDVYSLGVTLYELLTLGPAYEGGDRRELLRRIIEEAPKPLRSLVSGVPRELETIIQKATAREPDLRYGTAQELADDLRRFLDHRPIQARRPSLWMRARKMIRRHRTAVISVASVLLTFGVAGAIVLAQRNRANALEQSERSRRYVENIQAASHLIEKCHLDQARRTLALWLPRPGEDDIRSFPWFQLWRICTFQPTTWPGHSDAAAKDVYHVEISPRGDLLASSGQDGTVRLWDAETGRPLRTFRGHNGDVNYVAFSPDGAKLATGGDDGTVRLWSLSGSPDSIALGKHDNWVNCVLFTADGRKLVSGARDERIRLWDIASGQMLASVDVHSPIEGMTLAPDGRTLITGGQDGRIILWETDTLRELRDFGAHPHGVQCVAFSHDGTRVAAARRGGTVDVWDLARGQVVATGGVPRAAGANHVQSVAFSPDDRTLATCGDDGAVRLWDPSSGDPLQTYRAPSVRLWCVAFARDGRTVISSGADGMIRRWDLARHQDRTVIRLPRFEVQALGFAADSDRLLVAGRPQAEGGRRLTISSWDPRRGVLIDSKQADLAHEPASSRFSTDGKLVCVQELGGGLTLRDTATGGVAREAPVREAPTIYIAKIYINDNNITFNYYSNDKSVRTSCVWDTASGRVETRAGFFIPLGRLPDSGTVAVCTDNGVVAWDPETDRATGSTLPGVNPDLVRCSADGRFIAAGSNFTIRIVDSRMLQSERLLLAHPSEVTDLDFSPDGKVLASVSSDGTVKLWDLTTLQELRTLTTVPVQDQDRHRLRFSADGSYLVCSVWHPWRATSELIIWPTRPQDGRP